MARHLYFIRHIPSGQWYIGKYGFSEDFDEASVFHQRVNAEKKAKSTVSLRVNNPVFRLSWGNTRVPLIKDSINDLEIVEFELVQKV